MGNTIASHMESAMKKNTEEMMIKQQESMREQQRIMMERQIEMNSAMMERQMAMQLARARDMFHWWLAFYSIAIFGMFGGFKKTKKPAMLAPLLPLTFIVGYQLDLAYLGKLTRIKGEAENIMSKECWLLAVPGGLPTVDYLDQMRRKK